MEPEKSPNPRNLALRRLTVREYSSVEMLGYLRRKGIPEGEAQAVVQELEEQGLIDPSRYAGAIARAQIARGKGPLAVFLKLKQKGVPADLSLARKLYQAESTLPEVEAVKQLLAGRYSGTDLSDRKALARLYRALLRRGFSPEVVRSALDFID